MKKCLFFFPIILLMIGLSGCTLSLLGKPEGSGTTIAIPSPTSEGGLPTVEVPTLVIATPTLALPSLTPGAQVATLPPAASTATNPAAMQPSGPYAVTGILPGDVLNIRSGPGAENSITGTFNTSATIIMRTGLEATANGEQWVQVQNPSGGTGWVNAAFLTEAVAAANFCSDSRINTLLDSFGNALITRNGQALADVVSPAHGLSMYLWRFGTPHTFKQGDARWLFDSTYSHDWGQAPGSGLETVGSFQEKVLPFLQEVFSASHTLTCNSLGTAAQYGEHPWPQEYSNLNFYTVLKPGTPGVDLDFRYWLVGVEYVQGKPYIFAAIHFAWEP